ncbi:MAG: XdhC family protein [Anaerolineae bacterium]|nr:MAG: XdhC family protein [Anaerolineae bacterium]
MPTIYQALAELEAKHQPAALCTVVRSRGSTPRHSASKMLVYPDGRILGSIGGGELENRVIQAALEAIRDGQARLLEYNMSDPARGDPGVCGGQVEVFVDPILPPPLLLVVGGGHVGKAVVHLGKWLGFRVALADDRPEFCTPEAVPGADAYYPVPLSELPQHVEITPQTYIVLATRGVDIDAPGLPTLLQTPAAYIGVIGSRRRWATTTQRLREQGVAEEQIQRVHSPIGLEIQAETPEEIAVSILAEIIMLRNGGTGKPMKAEV